MRRFITKTKLMVIPAIFILIMTVIAIVFSEDAGGGCGSGCVGNGKSVSQLSCTYDLKTGKPIGFSCSVSPYGINNTMKCCCCPADPME